METHDPLFIRYVAEINELPLIPLEDEEKLAKLIRKGNAAARTRLIEGNLRLVVKIALEYTGFGLPLMDIISEGNRGLIKAAGRFDPRKGGKMSTYASWWIKQSIKRALSNQGKTIRLPVHINDKIHKIRLVTAQLEGMLGREPTESELAEEIGISQERLEQLVNMSVRPLSLDAPYARDQDATISDVTEDENAECPVSRVVSIEMHSKLESMLDVLTARERTVIELRYGLNGKKEKTLEQVGAKLGVTRERIRQIQNYATQKMSKAANKRNL